MLSIGYPDRLSLMSVLSSFLNCCPGCHGVMIHIPFCGTPGVQSAHSRVCSRVMLGPVLFALFLRKLVSSIETDDVTLT